MRSPTEVEWREHVKAQEQANKQYFEQEKNLEKARKDLLINEYRSQQQEKERQQKQKAEAFAEEQQKMEQEIQKYKGDQLNNANQQRNLKMNLAQIYSDQIEQKKSTQLQNRRRQLEEEENRLEASLRQLEEEKQKQLRLREQARQEMIQFYHEKSHQGRYQDNSLNQQQSSIQSSSSRGDDYSIVSIGNHQKFQQYMKDFNDKQAVLAKNFIPFDNNKGNRIDDLVQRGLQQDHQRWLEEEQLKRNHLQSRRLDLKNGLQLQLAMKEKTNQQMKQEFLDNQSQVMQRSNDYLADQTSLRQKRISQKQLYKDILDSQLAEKEQTKLNSGQISPLKPSVTDLSPDSRSGPITQLKTPTTQSLQSSSSAITLGHNPLTNPIPSNLQNPYLLRQLQSSQMNINQGSQNRLNYASIAQSNIVGANQKKTQIF